MRAPAAHGRESERGQASVELVGGLPAVLLVVLCVWQLAVAGHTSWLAANAARVAARAHAVGRDPEAAARSALPSYLRRQLLVREHGDRVVVRVALPLLVRRWSTPLRIGASAAMRRQQ